MGREGVAVGMLERTEGSSWVLWGLAWVRVEGEAKEGEGSWCWAGWGPVSSEDPSGSDPRHPG